MEMILALCLSIVLMSLVILAIKLAPHPNERNIYVVTREMEEVRKEINLFPESKILRKRLRELKQEIINLTNDG